MLLIRLGDKNKNQRNIKFTIMSSIMQKQTNQNNRKIQIENKFATKYNDRCFFMQRKHNLPHVAEVKLLLKTTHTRQL